MNIGRLIRHLLSHVHKVAPHFSKGDLAQITHAISASEAQHTGQICFAVEGALEVSALLKNLSPRERGIEVFSQLRVWDTEQNNGVLIYVLLADRAVEIVMDRGISTVVDPRELEIICLEMEAKFAIEQCRLGVIFGIDKVTQLLHQHFPKVSRSPNEISDVPVMLP